MQKKYVKVLHLELVIGYSTVFTYIIGKLGQHLQGGPAKVRSTYIFDGNI